MNKKIRIALDILKGFEPRPNEITPPVIHQLSETKKKFNLPKFLKDTDFIAGIGMGLKSSEQRTDNQRECIIFFLRRPLGPQRIDELKITIVKWLEESSLGYIPIEIKPSGEAELLSKLATKKDPLVGGYSVGHCKSKSGGTFGCLVRDNDQGNVFILSNSHVIAQSGLAQVGDDIVHPCIKDGGRQGADTIAHLHTSIPFGPRPSVNLIDAALATPKDGVTIKPEIAIINRPPSRTADATLGMKVQKVGRTTGRTIDGTVTAVDVLWRGIFYPDLGRSFDFDKLIVSDLWCEKGDSGAILLNDHFEAVGLCTFKIGNDSMSIPMKTICKTFNVAVVT